MKKFSVILITVFLMTIGCEKNEQLDPQPKEVREFLNSNDFERNKSTISEYGDIGVGKVDTFLVEFFQPDFDLNIKRWESSLMIPLSKGNRLVAYIQVVLVEGTKRLPYGDKYAMNLILLSPGFDPETVTGTMKMFDLNYDCFMHSEASVVNRKITSWLVFEMPLTLSMKYDNLKVASKNMLLCDLNGNGNVGFFECYKCLSDAIRANGFSQFICDLPLVGWLSCGTTKSLACAYISLVY